MGEDREGCFHLAAFLCTVKKRSVVDLALLSIIRECLSVEGQQLCHPENFPK